jgi:hypothetical protein
MPVIREDFIVVGESTEIAEDSESVNHLRDFAIERMDNFWKRGLRLLAQYRGNPMMARDCFYVAFGIGEMVGVESAVEIAVRYFKNPKKKAAASKCIAMFRDCAGIKDMPGQRGEDGRKKMSTKRNGQLK